MNQNLYALENLIIRLQGSQIIHFTYNQNTLRLQIRTPVAPQLLPGSDTVNLVLGECTKLFYLSYTQPQEDRIPQVDTEHFFSKGLQIQGIELRNREMADKKMNEGFIIYCNSYLHTIEAGELHLTAHHFQLYDQEFGIISYDSFLQAAGKLNADL